MRLTAVLLTLGFLLSAFIPISAEITLFVDAINFLDYENNTLLTVIYQVPYNQLQFVRTDIGFLADLKVNFEIFREDSLVYDKNFTNKIIVTAEDVTYTEEGYTDKISITLSRGGYRIQLVFTDLNSLETGAWSKLCELLPENAMISEIEFSHDVRADTTISQDKFHRGDQLFFPEPDHIFNLDRTQTMYIYYEFQNFSHGENGNTDLLENLVISRDDVILQEIPDRILSDKEWLPRLKRIDLSSLESGLYKLDVVLRDNISGREETRSDLFSVMVKKQKKQHMFTDSEEEYQLMRYFWHSSQLKNWKELSQDGKANLVDRFWSSFDPDPFTTENEFFLEIKKRIEYCNNFFSHFADGWTTDRGRIYIRQGAPDETRDLTTGLNTRLGTKDLTIWKYRGKKNLTYLFLDVQTSGNFKLIYAENDDLESSLSDWESYLGEDFDYDLLN
ncbi:MAG: GWxTD domain-containing protein [Candidatus Cloacimonetes bacterium]|nr:GWxTD domain-containing protein [Candidatus Cloacimonadota bacterium]